MNYEELWEKHCNFFNQTFSEQLQFNEKMIKDNFDEWKKTATAKAICRDNNLINMNTLPLTEYGDYPILKEFKEKIEDKVLTEPRQKGELWHDYYTRILNQTLDVVEGYLADRVSMCIKTTGTTGSSKFVIHGERFQNGFISDTIANVLMACSRTWGEKVFSEKPNALNLVAPVPYLGGWALRYWEEIVNFVPPIAFTDNVSDFGRKFYQALKMIEKGKKIHLAGGSGALLYMAYNYFTDPTFFFSESYKRTPIWYKRALIYLKLIFTRIVGKRNFDLQKMMPLKGVIIGSTDAHIYAEFFKEKFGIEPLNSYSATEIGCAMFGRPDNKLEFFPNLRSAYLEFLNEKEEIKKIHELQKNKTYELIVTPFFSMFFRYRIKDIFRVTDFYDECPVFSYEGRKQNMLDFYNYYRVSEDLMAKVVVDAGFRACDRWIVTKSPDQTEQLCIFFEREWPIKERDVEKLIFNSMISLVPGFSNYVKDFGIKSPSEVIRVNFFEIGTFTKYAIRQARKNVPLGQYKPFKIVPENMHSVIDELKECSKK